MEAFDCAIVGGGPAGSSCAWRLRRAGVNCVVLDRLAFPRTKLCAGWVTPEVLHDLEMIPEQYPHRFLTFPKLRIHLGRLGFDHKTVQHSIRRYEFDHWLLERSGAPVREHYVKSIERKDGDYVIDGQYRVHYLVGAGGTKCPVYRSFFREANPRAKELQAVTLEKEFPYRWEDPTCHLWFFEHGLPGYSWYVPKEDGYLNVGVGGMAHKIKQRGDDIKHHWGRFIERLRGDRLIDGESPEPGGYSYFLRAGVERVRVDNAFIAGDAAGLATRDLCEGIGPAVRSGLLAAEAIESGRREYSVAEIERYTTESRPVRWLLEYMFINRRA